MTAAADRSDQQAEAGDPRSRGTGSQPHLEPVEGQAAQFGAATLLAVERRVRAAKDEVEIAHLIANELRRLVSGRQSIVLRLVRPHRFEVVSISSLVLSEKDTPFVRWLHGMVAALVAEHGRSQAIVFDLPAFTEPESPETRSYPFRHFVWQPLLLPAGEAFAGLLIARERSWQSAECQLIAREAEAFANAWQALHGARALRPRRRRSRWTAVLVAAGVVAAGACPVPMTVLAPVEIVADGPQRVTAPLDGVIKRILVEPNRRVQIGQPILSFDETALRNRHQVAEREMRLAEARYLRLGQAAFSDDVARHELAQARAEFELKKAELDYSAQMLGRASILAERSGVLVYSGKDRWIGRPVRTGERIMQIVDPGRVTARIELPVADAIVLARGATARLFLDANPLKAVDARVISEGYQAEPNATQQLVYHVYAEFKGGTDGIRIGARGTAQLIGSEVSLAFYLFRRPISAVRQQLGL